MAKGFKADPAFNLKTGADSEFYYAREVTKKGEDLGKIKCRDGLFRYPVLTRSTGNSLKGTVESIESNELRKGRTKSAPRKGNESSEGSLDIEFSPTTYDDMLEAGFRGKWKRWTSDTDSDTNKKDNDGYKQVFNDGYFATACGRKGSKRLLRFEGDDNGIENTEKVLDSEKDDCGLILVPRGSVVDELTVGTTDIKYDGLRKYGGTEGEDIYQDFKHLAVNEVSLSVEVNAIITGSVAFMGANDPQMRSTDEITTDYGGTKADGTPDTSRFLGDLSDGKKYMANLPEKATSTDQFTAREGFLRLNGKLIEFATGIDTTLNNGLEKKYAIFVKPAIATTPLTLEITGTLKLYLINEASDKIFNSAVKDEDNEILFVLQDKDENPHYLYVFQIFKTKFTEHDSSVSGADVIELSLPYSSFEERAMRIFRIVLPQVESIKAPYDETVRDDAPKQVILTPNVPVTEADIKNLKVSMSIDDVDCGDVFTTALCLDKDPVTGLEAENYGRIIVTRKAAPAAGGGTGTTFAMRSKARDASAPNIVDRTKKDQRLTVHVEWNGETSDANILIKKNVVVPPNALTTVVTPTAVHLVADGNAEVELSALDDAGEVYDDDLTFRIVADVGDADGTTNLLNDATKRAYVNGTTLCIPEAHNMGTVRVQVVFRDGADDMVEGDVVDVTVNSYGVTAITAVFSDGTNEATSLETPTADTDITIIAKDQLGRTVSSDVAFSLVSDVADDGTGTLVDVTADATKATVLTDSTLAILAAHGVGEVGIKVIYTGEGANLESDTVILTLAPIPVKSMTIIPASANLTLDDENPVTTTFTAVDQLQRPVTGVVYTITSDLGGADHTTDMSTGAKAASIANDTLTVPADRGRGEVKVTGAYSVTDADGNVTTVTSDEASVAILTAPVSSVVVTASSTSVDLGDPSVTASGVDVTMSAVDQNEEVLNPAYIIASDADTTNTATILANVLTIQQAHATGDIKIKGRYTPDSGSAIDSAEVTISVVAVPVTAVTASVNQAGSAQNTILISDTADTVVPLTATDQLGRDVTSDTTFTITNDVGA